MQSISGVENLTLNQSSTSTVSLKSGQMVYGKVHHIYSNQTAEITIGQTKIHAKLDAPIAAGERYLFQVQNSREMTTLKVLPQTGTTETIMDRAQSLLQHLSFVQSKETLNVAQFFVKNNIPITKEQMLQAIQWASKTGDMSKTLQALKTMNNLSLPFNELVYRAMVAFESKVALQSLFSTVLKGVERGASASERALKALLTHFLSSDVEKAADRGLQKLVSTWLSSEDSTKNATFRMLQEIGFFSKQADPSAILLKSMQTLNGDHTFISSVSVKQAAQLLVQLMQNKQADNANTVSQLSRIVLNGLQQTMDNTVENSLWKQVQMVLQESSSHTLTARSLEAIAKSILAYVHITNQDVISAHQTAPTLTTSLGEEKNDEKAKQYIGNLLLQMVEGKALPKGVSLPLQRLLVEEAAMLSTPKSELIANELKTTFRLLGLGFENTLSTMEQGTTIKENELLTLKPLLMKLLNETQSHSVKDSVELLINKITAQQILSQSSGPIQHLLIQFPFALQQNQSEVMMQWSGRKNKDGSIDPTYCRILFYLQLKNIQETVIDVVVQNSIMKVTILNEQAPVLKAVSQPFLSQMKEKLGEVGYQVSSISFEKTTSTRSSISNAQEKNGMYENISYNGVDIKI